MNSMRIFARNTLYASLVGGMLAACADPLGDVPPAERERLMRIAQGDLGAATSEIENRSICSWTWPTSGSVWRLLWLTLAVRDADRSVANNHLN